MSPVVVRPALSVDRPELQRLAALDSARAPDGDVLLAFEGGELRAALSVQTGAAVADPFRRTAHLVELLRTAARPATSRRRLPRLPRLRARRLAHA